MPQITEIVKQEQQRTTLAECRTARLYREGSFMRAYEWSAWLFVKYVSDFKVSNRQIKSLGQPIAMIGFPPTSMGKFVPESAQLTPAADGSVTIVLPATLIADDVEPQVLLSEFAEWKQALPVTESNSSKKERERNMLPAGGVPENKSSSAGTPSTLTSVMQRIMAFPVETKSPVESMLFLSEIRMQLANLI